MNSDANSELRPARQSSEPKSDVIRRLKVAVRVGGGNKAVANRTGIPLGTLNNYTREIHRMPAEAAAQIAAACNVSIDWLLRGEGPMEYLPVGHVTAEGSVVVGGSGSPFMPFLPTEPVKPAPLFGSVDMNRLATAINISEEAFRRRKLTPSDFRKAQVFIAIYDELIDANPEKVRALIHLLDTEDLQQPDQV